MIKDLLVSFKDNVQRRTTNPFLGTFAIVWLLRNWKLVYTFFYFDSSTTLNQRINIIATYFTANKFTVDLLWNIWWTLIALTTTLILINLSRLIVNLFEKRLTPWIYRITDSNSVVLKETYDSLRNEKFELEIKFEAERDSKSKLQKEISDGLEELMDG